MASSREALRARLRSIPILACVVFAVLAVALSARVGLATDGARVTDLVEQGNGYSAVLYDNTNGLPTSEANDIAHTSEGFIWIGSYAGLIRYDGYTFERMNSTTGVGSVVCLLVDSQDRLWVGTNDNGLALLKQNTFKLWTVDHGLGAAKVCDITEDEDGIIYVATTAGISMIYPDMSLRRLNDPRIFNAYVDKMVLGNDGLMYCITNEDDVFTLRNGELETYVNHKNTIVDDIVCVLPIEGTENEFYFGAGDSMLYRGNPLDTSAQLEAIDIAPLTNVMDLKKIDGQIWICARNGIGMLDDQGLHLIPNLPMNNSVQHVMQDYEGNLWFCSSRQGVMKVVHNNFDDVFTRYGLEPAVVNSTCMYEGKLLIGTDMGLIVLDDDGPVTSFPITSAATASGTDLEATDLLELLDGDRIRSLVVDSQGRLWISTWRGLGLLRYDHGSVTTFTDAEGLFSDHIRVVCETADGSMLVANTGGVSIIKDDRVIANYGKDDHISNQEILTVSSAPNGDIVLGSNGDGIYVISAEGTTNIGTKEGLTSGIIMRIKYDAQHDLYWIVTSNSLAYMTADYHVTTIRKFPYSNNFDLYENDKGDMWVLSSNGIYVVPTVKLIANGELDPVHYGMANGLPCTSTSNSYSELTDEGDLYIAGNTGVAKVNINSPMEDVGDLKQAVPFIVVDGDFVFPNLDGSFTIPSDVQKLTIYPYVYNYSLTDPQVSYRLVGFDRKATTVMRSELDAISYTNLPGRTYWFIMELTDAMGRVSQSFSVRIDKEKAIYEQSWFYAGVALTSALVLALLVHWYVRRKMHTLEEQHREEAERERILNELKMANQIQASMLPHVFPPFPERKEFDLFASMDPAREVGGDFYDFFLIDDDHLCLVIADVSGKGIPAALFMMVSKVILQSFATMDQSAAQILVKTNEALSSDNQAEMFVTVWLGILEISTGKLIAANAGHEYPAIRRAGQSFELLRDKHGLVLGIMEGVRYREYELQLDPGDTIFVYTDGVPEATDAEENMFGNDRMLAALNTDPDANPKQILINVRSAVDEYAAGAEQYDDLTMLCLRYNGES